MDGYQIDFGFPVTRTVRGSGKAPPREAAAVSTESFSEIKRVSSAASDSPTLSITEGIAMTSMHALMTVLI